MQTVRADNIRIIFLYLSLPLRPIQSEVIKINRGPSQRQKRKGVRSCGILSGAAAARLGGCFPRLSYRISESRKCQSWKEPAPPRCRGRAALRRPCCRAREDAPTRGHGGPRPAASRRTVLGRVRGQARGGGGSVGRWPYRGQGSGSGPGSRWFLSHSCTMRGPKSAPRGAAPAGPRLSHCALTPA